MNRLPVGYKSVITPLYRDMAVYTHSSLGRYAPSGVVLIYYARARAALRAESHAHIRARTVRWPREGQCRTARRRASKVRVRDAAPSHIAVGATSQRCPSDVGARWSSSAHVCISYYYYYYYYTHQYRCKYQGMRRIK